MRCSISQSSMKYNLKVRDTVYRKAKIYKVGYQMLVRVKTGMVTLEANRPQTPGKFSQGCTRRYLRVYHSIPCESKEPRNN